MRLQWREGMPTQPDTPAPRVAPLPSPPATPTPPARATGTQVPEAPAKLLIVGPDINLSGEITACDRLVVEGSVQVTLNRTRAIEIAETGRRNVPPRLKSAAKPDARLSRGSGAAGSTVCGSRSAILAR